MVIRPFTKTYDKKTVLKTDRIELRDGLIYAVIGANGSGKSTFGKVLSGVIRPDRNDTVLESSCRVAYMPQHAYAFRMSTFKNVMLGGNDEKRALDHMRFLDIEALKDQRADRLSGGETARMALARTLMRPYDLLILDEPSASMDVSSALKAEEMIMNYRNETGCIIILITHNLKQVRRMAQQVMFFSRGSILEKGPVADVLDHPAYEETKRFLDYNI